jgi:hypothetical protein
MDLKGILEWIASNTGSTVATLAPYLVAGIVGLYLLWLVVGYLRVSQVGIAAERRTEPALPLPAAAEGAMARPRGVPYCPTDRLQFPSGAQFCPRCEGDLLVDCANCGTTIRAADAACFRCGTREPLAASAGEG